MFPFRSFFLSFSFAGLTIFGCAHHSAPSVEGGQVDLDQQVTNKLSAQNDVFLHFEQNWQKFITRAPELRKPVLEKLQSSWQPAVITDCRYSAALGHNVPVVELSWNEALPVNTPAGFQADAADTRNLRFDISLNYKGFERNYYTTVFPIASNQRFNIPEQSAFIRDTAAVIMAGPALLPKVVDFQQIRVKVNSSDMVKKILHLTELAPGAAYRIRLCTLIGESWSPSGEFVFNTPICPVDKQ